MYLKNIELLNFRNYEKEKINLIDGLNLFVGDNAQGKTNIIESVYISAFGKSYRTGKDNEIIKFGEDSTHININYKKNNIDSSIEFYIDRLNRKNIKKDGVRVTKISEHLGELLIVIFSPDSLDIVKGSPAKRRNFIDIICSQLSKSYVISLQEYMKCLKLKNSMLKKDFVDKEYIYVLNEKMSEYIERISTFRKEILTKLLIKAKIIHENITSSKEEIDVKYISDFVNLNRENIKEILDSYLNIEIIRKSCVKGIQRDDIEIYINNLKVDTYGSQGQNRTALLTLKLADFEVLKDEKSNTPILLLDDIMSELDATRISFLLKYIEKYQSIITTTDSNFIKNKLNIQILEVNNGKIIN